MIQSGGLVSLALNFELFTSHKLLFTFYSLNKRALKHNPLKKKHELYIFSKVALMHITLD